MDFEEFVQFMVSKKNAMLQDGTSETSMRRAFKLLDKDRSGYITAKELRVYLSQLGEKVTQKEASDIVRDADKNGDGRISCDEFVAMMADE